MPPPFGGGGRIAPGGAPKSGTSPKNSPQLNNSLGGSGTDLRYELKAKDVDWRNTGKTFQNGLDEAFKRTGVPRDQFKPTKWRKNVYGKSVPVEYVGLNNAEVSVDYPHKAPLSKSGEWQTRPDAPHIGWQVGKGTNRTKGHIIIDSVPAGRP
jgi:hypothetical protein